jgi:hypothetical protein
MIRIAKYLSAKIDSKARRLVKSLVLGKRDVQLSYEASPFGVDGKPVADMRAVHVRTGVKGETAIIGYINLNQKAKDGELVLYSTKADDGSSEQAYMHLKNDGDLELNGDQDHLVRFSELKSAYDELRGDLNEMVSTWNTFADEYSPGQGGSPPNASKAPKSSASVDPAKVDTVKTP